jgi:hypothetical protein
MNAARVAAGTWTVRLRGVLAELAVARLRWCLICGRVGPRGWRPLYAAMPITWVCADRASCRGRCALQVSQQKRAWRRLVRRRPGLAGPPTGRPWHPAEVAGSDGVLNLSQPRGHRLLAYGAVAAELAAGAADQPGELSAELWVMMRPRPDPATSGWSGSRQ